MNFSKYILSSLNDIFASCFTKSYAFSNCSLEYATLIPLPPPPLDAFNITGYFIFSAISIACFFDFISPSDPRNYWHSGFFHCLLGF